MKRNVDPKIFILVIAFVVVLAVAIIMLFNGDRRSVEGQKLQKIEVEGSGQKVEGM